MDITFNRDYKGTNIEIVVEDDIITTSKIYKDGECVECSDITDNKGGDIPFCGKNYYAVLDMAKKSVDENFAVEVATATR